MAGIGKNWNGKVYGTNTGNVALSLDGEDDSLTGVVRLSDDRFGLAVYNVTGSFISGAITLAGDFEGEDDPDMSFGSLTVDGSLTAEGKIEGTWSTTIGTGGTFQLWPHNFAVTPSAAGLLPEQLNSSSRSIGAVRMYSNDIVGLIDQITKDFSQKRAVVTYQENGSEKHVYSEHFTAIIGSLPELRYLKISVSEPEMYGINRHASIELNSNGENVILAQSVQESWAIGKSESLTRHLGKYKRTFATQFRKFGLTVNIAITLAALAALPGLPNFWSRLGFAASVLGVQSLITFLHGKYVTNFVSYSSETKPSLLRKIFPGVASWAIAIVGAVIAAVIYGLLKGELADSPLLEFMTWQKK